MQFLPSDRSQPPSRTVVSMHGRAPLGHPEASTTQQLSRAEWLAFLYVDQHQRWHRGERALVENYLQAQPKLLADDEGVLDLIFSEMVLREALGEAPQL